MTAEYVMPALPGPHVEVSFAEDRRTVLLWQYNDDGSAWLWTHELGARPGSQCKAPALIEGV